ncbi:MAG: DNA-directed RNA polymerase subunit beta [Minisyncoccales bacterium]|jgi:DNA-directed RNA polymerase subunit beta
MQNILTKNFGKSKVSLPRPYLLSLQKESWDRMWNEGLRNLFKEVSPIRDYTGKEWEIWFLDYKVDEPKLDEEEAKANNDSYEASVRVTVKLVNLKTKETKEQEVYLADFPIMTDRGTFIVNGVERVAISQLIRSPGVFFTSQFNHGKNLFGAKIIPNRGAWLELETESTGALSVKIDKKRKISAVALLRAFYLLSKKDGEIKDDEIKDLFKDSDIGEINHINETLVKDEIKTGEEALIEIYKRIRPGDIATPETAAELIENTFFNFARYDLSEVGRWRMIQRLDYGKSNKNVTVEDRVLLYEDIVEVIREMIKLNNDPQGKADQIDHLGHRRVRTAAEILENRLRLGLLRMERHIKDRMSTLEPHTMTPSQLINVRPFIAVVKEFFTSSQISQFMDNENPLAELEHKRRLTATGPGGLTRERAGFEARDVQPSHYGRICPIETPEGPNVGLVVHLATFARVNRYGFIETPYFKVEKGKIGSKVDYLNAYEEERYNIAHGGVEINDKREIVPTRVEARIKGEPGVIERDKIDYIDVSAEQFISAATSCIPFLQNDDANRALMGSNMQRQSVPLINPAPPLVSTGMEERIASDSGQIIISKTDGVVTEVDANRITIKPSKGEVVSYKLKTFTRTNQYTCFHQKARVKKGQKIKKGDILCDGGGVADGRLALGQNLLVAFLSWRGLNFEDAIIVSERLAQKDTYTSIHIESVFCDVRETKLGPELTTSDIPNVSEKKLKDLDEEGIIRIGAEVGPNDILVGKISPKGEADMTAEERLLKAIFGEKAKEVKDTSLVMEHGKRGRVIGVKVFSREMGHKLDPGVIKRIEVEIAELRRVEAGDKLAGRHGNKGIISKVLPVEEMPYLEDGTPVDIILNPLSVASRMNIGQILETHLGWAAHKNGYVAITPSLSGADEDDIKKELKKAGLPETGSVKLFDGRSGEAFPQPITVGMIYMMKLIHMVRDKIHMRSIGPYSLITQQPLGGKAQFGGQRLGEMEVWALEGHGAAYTLQEMLTIKSDDVIGRATAYESILKGETIKHPNIPSSFSLLINELKALALGAEVLEKKN